MDLADGSTVEIAGMTISPHKRDALAARVRQLLHARTQGTTAARGLGREGRSVEEWKKHLRGGVGYRVAAAAPEALAELLQAPGTPAEERVGAALALMSDLAAAPRVRVAAEACADPDTRAALEAIAEERDDERIVLRALRADGSD